MDFLLEPLLEMEEYNAVRNALCDKRGPIEVVGPSDSQKAHFVAGIIRHSSQKGLFVAFNELQAIRMHRDFQLFFGEDALLFPAREITLLDIAARSNDAERLRLKAMERMVQGKYKVIVTSIEALALRTLPRQEYEKLILEVKPGMVMDTDRVIRQLTLLGYEHSERVEGRGQFSVRGGIIDVFPSDFETAVRIDFFDNEVDSVRMFDCETQRSIDSIDRIRIIPAREVVFREESIGGICDEIKKSLTRHSKRNNGGKTVQGLTQRVEGDLERFRDQSDFPGIDAYIPFIFKGKGTISEYLEDVSFFIDEPLRVRQRLENRILEYQEDCRSLLVKGEILPEATDHYYHIDDIEKELYGKSTLLMSVLSSNKVWAAKTYEIQAKQLSSYHGHFNLMGEDILKWKNEHMKVIVLSGLKGRGERLSENFSKNDIHAPYADIPKEIKAGSVIITKGALEKGFIYPAIGLVVVAGGEFSASEKNKVSTRKRKIKEGSKISAFTDLKVGDFVVHEVHGIGQYVGIEQVNAAGVIRDYIKIRYQAEGFLYIPTDQLSYIQKYIGSDGKAPKLNKLGGSEWTRVKNKVKQSLMLLAEELVKLYAKRETAQGTAYSPDTVWQRQFEDMFPFEETEDQLKAAEEIKEDMEKIRPMDRLLCGDVGYGKTEVAVRAVFKAVMDGKQVAYLCPTTVLAQQQYQNFIERMRDFPVSIDVMSRFRSKAEQKESVKAIGEGKIDVVVGTHRILSKDINIPKLGLLVVDEEQRFGVKHKERIKELSPDIDVLTLTATPIPRTLHMSLTGIRDISILETPPEERYPVQTYVMEYDEGVVDDAIMREVARGGQVFYLYNTVRTINIHADRLRKRMPDVSFAVAHGQMHETELEDIMQAFITGHYDVLVCTTIIESGLDMPNVNTMIIENAERLGLSQLYQIRGRVGRSNKLGYAYITYKKDRVLPEYAEKRLQAIKEFTEFGSGFKIAMRDLEIRGAGNLLGPEQHGHMESVGYDMYCKLLEEAVKEIQGEEIKDASASEAVIELDVSAFIDTSYIRAEESRVELYRKILEISSEEDAIDVKDEIMDRFGELPNETDTLIDIARIKAMASDLGMSSVSLKNGVVTFTYRKSEHFNVAAIGELISTYNNRISINASASPSIALKVDKMDGNGCINEVLQFLRACLKS